MKTIYAILSCALMLLMGSCVHRSKSEDYAATHTPDIEAISAFRAVSYTHLTLPTIA